MILGQIFEIYEPKAMIFMKILWIFATPDRKNHQISLKTQNFQISWFYNVENTIEIQFSNFYQNRLTTDLSEIAPREFGFTE